MNDTTHQVVILDNFSSPYIKQAIIVLKNFNPELQTKIIRDAEAIVNEYMNKLPAQAAFIPPKPPVSPKRHTLLRLCIAGGFVLLAVGIILFGRFI